MFRILHQISKEAVGLRFMWRLAYAALFFLIALTIGVVGFIIIEDYTFNEALYMTVITFSTVGYGEVHPLSDAGRDFTVLLIVLNLGVFTYVVSVLSTFVIEGDFRSVFKRNKMLQQIGKLKDHVIICGYGRLGKVVADDLIESGRKVLIVEQNPSVIDRLKDKDMLHLVGDATEEENILAMGIKKASTLITTFHTDATNTFVVLAARELNRDIEIISRSSKEANISKLKLAGANHVIIPEDIGGSYIASIVSGKMA